jgi:hypothetical protein
MERVFLGGTTTNTTWRQDLIERLMRRGIRSEQIINPHLPKGVKYTHEHMLAERAYKNDPNTIVLIHICRAVLDSKGADEAIIADKEERLGPISMFEIGKYAYSQPHRTAIVLDFASFTEGGRSRRVLEGLARELYDDFSGNPPYFSSIDIAEEWVASMLLETT